MMHWLLLLVLTCLIATTCADDGRVVFAAVGDFGYNGTEGEARVSHAMNTWCAKMGCGFMVSVGDNFYQSGVASVDDPQFDSSWAQLFDGAMLMSLGNHDYYGNPVAQLQYADRNQRWLMPDRHYTYWLNSSAVRLRFVVVDSTPLVRSYANSSKINHTDYDRQQPLLQFRWLADTLAVRGDFTTVVIVHHPSYTPAADTETLPPAVDELFRLNNVPLVLSGHCHNLQHVWFPDRPRPHYLITGAGGKLKKQQWSPDNCHQCSSWYRVLHGFVGIVVTPADIQVHYYDTDLTVLHQFSVNLV